LPYAFCLSNVIPVPLVHIHSFFPRGQQVLVQNWLLLWPSKCSLAWNQEPSRLRETYLFTDSSQFAPVYCVPCSCAIDAGTVMTAASGTSGWWCSRIEKTEVYGLCVAFTRTRGRGLESPAKGMYFWKSGFKLAFGKNKKGKIFWNS